MKSIEEDIIFGKGLRTSLIAEIGVNHDGNVEKAKKLAVLAMENGADLVKFQIFVASEEISNYARMTEYQRNNTKTEQNQLEMAQKLELSFSEHIKLAEFCDFNKIPRIYSVFDFKSLNFLSKELGQTIVKIPSGEITNFLFLETLNTLKYHLESILIDVTLEIPFLFLIFHGCPCIIVNDSALTF